MRELLQQIIQTHGRLDFLFNNAGITGDTFGPGAFLGEFIHTSDADDFLRVMNINLLAVKASVEACLQIMTKQGHGVIVDNSSIMGLRSTNWNSLGYHVSKFGVAGLTKGCSLMANGQGQSVFSVPRFL